MAPQRAKHAATLLGPTSTKVLFTDGVSAPPWTTPISSTVLDDMQGGRDPRRRHPGDLLLHFSREDRSLYADCIDIGQNHVRHHAEPVSSKGHVMTARNRIDVHHHIVPQEYVKALQSISIHSGGGDTPFPPWSPELALEFMDQNGIASAVTSISAPGVYFGDVAFARSLARRCNEISARLISDHPQRFGAFAVVPLPDVDGSLSEVDYALDTLKLDGVVLLSNIGAQYLGDPAFNPLFEELQRRRTVVFIHPNDSPRVNAASIPVPQFLIEFTFNTTRAIVNLIASSTLERCPDIRFIASHAGGTAPYLAWRIAYPGDLGPERVFKGLKSLYYDVALSANPHALRSLQELVEPSHILFGSDFPFARERPRLQNIQNLEAYDGFDEVSRKGVDRTNAFDLFPRFRTT